MCNVHGPESCSLYTVIPNLLAKEDYTKILRAEQSERHISHKGPLLKGNERHWATETVNSLDSYDFGNFTLAKVLSPGSSNAHLICDLMRINFYDLGLGHPCSACFFIPTKPNKYDVNKISTFIYIGHPFSDCSPYPQGITSIM